VYRHTLKETLTDFEQVQRDVNKVYEYGMFPNAGQKKPNPITPLEIPLVKGFVAGVMGGGLGMLLGLFLSSNQAAIHPLYPKLTSKQQFRVMLAETKNGMWLRAKSFGGFGLVYATTECLIERYRAKADMKNAIYAGVLTGGLVAARSGPLAMGLSAAGMAAFSLGIEWWQHGFHK